MDIIHILHAEVTALGEEIASLLFNEPLALEPLSAKLNELRGVCRLLEIPAAVSLLEELENTVKVLADKGESLLTLQPELSTILEIIPRLMGNLPWTNRIIPFLFMPELANLRRLQGLPPLYEFQLVDHHHWPPSSRFHGETPLTDDARTALKKLKQLYQMGLLDILRGSNEAKGAEVLTRVVARLQLVFTSPAEVKYWSLVESVTSAMARGALVFNPVRMRLLAAVERQLKTLLDGPGGKSPYPLGLWRAFAILLAMVPDRDAGDLEVGQWCGAPRFDFTDRDISEARAIVFDDESEDLDGFVQEVEARVSVIHSLLERIDSEGKLSEAESDAFASEIGELANLSGARGLSRAASRLHGHHLDILQAERQWLTRAELLGGIAHTILYLECLLLHFREHGLALRGLVGKLDMREVDDVVHQKLVASSISAVWSECLRKLSLVKELIDDIASERGTDDAAATLVTEFDEIRGAALLAGEIGVASIARRCRDFVSASWGAASRTVSSAGLPAFADAVVALEYYFRDSRQGGRAEFVLAIADDYLTELEAVIS